MPICTISYRPRQRRTGWEITVNIVDLYSLLGKLIDGKTLGEIEKMEIRIGDQVESGPYLNAAVGGVFKGTNGEVILCANDDDQWREEATGIDHDLPVLWKPPT